MKNKKEKETKSESAKVALEEVNSSDNDTVYVSSTLPRPFSLSTGWVLDMGASSHITNNLNLFIKHPI
jgi:hypothetical protein